MPIPWSIVAALGFSAAQIKMTGCPGWIEAGCAVKVTMRAGGAIRAGAPPARPACVGAGVWPADPIHTPRSRRPTVIEVRMCAIIPKREDVWIDADL